MEQMDYLKRSWAVVDLDQLDENVRLIRSMLPADTKIAGVVKADGYGHGDIAIAREMQENGAEWFAVSNADEAVGLRDHGIQRPILILGVSPVEMVETLAKKQITQVAFSLEYAKALNQEAQSKGVTLEVHLKFDTGMGRLGFYAPEGEEDALIQEVLQVAALPNLKITGAFTHFCCSDDRSGSARAYVHMQFDRFQTLSRLVQEAGVPLPLRHCCASGGVLLYPEMALDMARPGIILYGLYSDPDISNVLPLKPILSLYSTVAMVKEVQPGRYIGYGRTFQADHPMKIATVPIGYADGYPRSLSNRGRMIVNGQYAPIVGRVCMDQLMLDVTHIPGVKRGDRVTVIGQDGSCEIKMDDLAASVGTISNELICLIGKRIPRVYVKGGREVGVMDSIRQRP